MIRIRGLPFTTTKQEILDFFEDINIVSGEDGIHLAAFGLHSTKPLGEAYIELASEDDYEKAQGFHKKTMGSRYIEGTFGFDPSYAICDCMVAPVYLAYFFGYYFHSVGHHL